MAFFDRKEDVLSIELTSYGKKLLAEGKFNPVSYSFEDDEVLYDAGCAHVVETQNATQDRIFEAVRLKSYNTVGVETNVAKMKKLKGFPLGQPFNEDYHLTLGNNKAGSQFAPAWQMKCLHGELEESITYVTGSTTFINVPQLTAEVKYETRIEKGVQPEKGAEISTPHLLNVGVEKVYPDGSYIAMLEDFLFFELVEDNTTFETDNFEIEVCQINEELSSKASGSFTELIPMSFLKVSSETDIVNTEAGQVVDPSFVDYFFEVLTDKEIPTEYMCKYAGVSRKQGVYADKATRTCQIVPEQSTDVYITDVFDNEDCE